MKRLVVFALIFSLSHASSALAAGPLEEAARQAVQQLAQTSAQPSNRRALIWSGAALTGVGVGLIALANTALKKDECMEFTSGLFNVTECIQETNNAAAWAGLATAGVGAALMVVGFSRNVQIGPNRIAYRVWF